MSKNPFLILELFDNGKEVVIMTNKISYFFEAEGGTMVLVDCPHEELMHVHVKESIDFIVESLRDGVND